MAIIQSHPHGTDRHKGDGRRASLVRSPAAGMLSSRITMIVGRQRTGGCEWPACNGNALAVDSFVEDRRQVVMLFNTIDNNRPHGRHTGGGSCRGLQGLFGSFGPPSVASGGPFQSPAPPPPGPPLPSLPGTMPANTHRQRGSEGTTVAGAGA